MQPYPAHQELTNENLAVSDGHTINVRTYGNPKGLPVVFVHGGPGGAARAENTKFFDPDKYRVVLFDQRGCGNSKPFASLENNTTWDLVADMEVIREHLGIDTWTVFGGSWGSTLSLAYGVSHPKRCNAFVLRGIFLGTAAEVDHLYIDGASRHYPIEFAKFLEPVGGSTTNLIENYYALLTSDDDAIRHRAAVAWSQWEGSVSNLVPNAKQISDMGDPEFSAAFARIECHYFRNHCFFESPDFLLRKIDAIRHIPCTIVHGRYDVVCTPQVAYQLHRAWPESELHFVADAGHSAHEKGTTAILVQTMDRLANI